MYNPFLAVINSLLPEPQASLLNGILFGIKASMPKAFYNALITTGTLHIIALSGVNITILINLISRGTLWLGKKISILLTICLIALFVWFVGFQPSIVRAAIMGFFSLLSIYFGRQNWGLLSLFLAAGIMLLPISASFPASLSNYLSWPLWELFWQAEKPSANGKRAC